MKFDGKLKDLGPVKYENVLSFFNSLTPAHWHKQRMLSSRRNKTRPGRGYYFYYPEFDAKHNAEREEVGSLPSFSVFKVDASSDFFNIIDTFLREEIEPRYPNTIRYQAQIAELPSRMSIPKHMDSQGLTLVHRLHVPLVTALGVEFYVQDEKFFLQAGNLYELNNVLPHWVKNTSEIDRFHLLIDLMPESAALIEYADAVY